MRNKFFIAVVLTIFNLMNPLICHSQIRAAQKRKNADDLLYVELMKANLKEYIGKPIYLLLADKTMRKYKNYVGSDEPPGVLRSFIFEFSEKISIDVFPDGFHHIKQFSMNRDWRLGDIKKEKLQGLVIRDGYKVLKTLK